jgi:hypothetical protein
MLNSSKDSSMVFTNAQTDYNNNNSQTDYSSWKGLLVFIVEPAFTILMHWEITRPWKLNFSYHAIGTIQKNKISIPSQSIALPRNPGEQLILRTTFIVNTLMGCATVAMDSMRPEPV